MIRFDHASKTYPGGTRAVEDFSLTVEQGSTTVFLGTSGCGKTTLMRMVNAMVTPTSGRVFVRDQDVAGEDPVRLRRSIGYVLQEGGLFPHRSIADNIATVPRLEGVSKAESRERALELLTLALNLLLRLKQGFLLLRLRSLAGLLDNALRLILGRSYLSLRRTLACNIARSSTDGNSNNYR
mgnify:CR=1 FL=1